MNITNTSEKSDRSSNQEWTSSWNVFKHTDDSKPNCLSSTHLHQKNFRKESTHIPTRLLTEWCDHPRKVGRAILTNKQCIVRILQLVIPKVNDNGTLASWRFHALDASFWNTLLRKLKHIENDPTKSPPSTSFPQTISSPNYNRIQPPPPDSPRE